jgi:cyclophilin family peptidyl-prolyl cis-trans isomerase
MFRRILQTTALTILSAFILGQQCVPADPIGGDPNVYEPDPWVTIQTSKGPIVIELFKSQAPQSVSDFLRYVDEGYYNGSIFHEVHEDLGISGGMYTPALAAMETKALTNESNNGLTNIRGRVALNTPSGEEQGHPFFYIHLTHNPSFDYDAENGEDAQVTVIGRVIEGLDVVTEISQIETESAGEALPSVPVEDVVIEDVYVGTDTPGNDEDEPGDDGSGDDDTGDDGEDDSGDDQDDEDGDDGDDGDEDDNADDGENQAPTADVGPDRYVIPGLKVHLYAGRSSDPDDDELTYSWRKIDGPEVEIEDPDSHSAAFVYPSEVESMSVEVVVDDGNGGTDSDTITLTKVEDAHVEFVTSMGDIVIDVYENDAPITTMNFLKYVDAGFYHNTLFHNAQYNLMVRGGGFGVGFRPKMPIYDPIPNEFSEDRSNVAGTVGMVKRSGEPDSAQARFYFNVADNSESLDEQDGGYTVFAEVVQGMDVVRSISQVETHNVQDPESGVQLKDVPVEDVILERARIVPAPTAE